ncbi:unnamed protein product [Anisakis simplex]|uniref:Uncharacterized protein n=1 Tax=Anisakis simplex TaxID=6269 RepID=A0A0M3K7K6_ANISI|nr:unnamed protein product [Anisakis simplex]
MLKRRRTDERLLDNVLDDIYRNEDEFIVNDRRSSSSSHRIAPYKAAIIRVCQLQLKICSKMMELRSSSNSSNEEPSTLKRIARRSILRHSLRNRAGKISFLQNDDNVNDGSAFNIREVLPGELIDYLNDGVQEE